MSDKPTNKLNLNIFSALVGAGFILLSILFLLGRFVNAQFNIDIGHYAWPFFIIAPGLLLFIASFAFEHRLGSLLAIFGGMAAATGVILLVQNTFDLYETWAYAWALVVPTSIGLSALIYGSLRRLDYQVKSGLTLTGIGLAIFVLGGFFFELVIGISGFRFGAAWLCWPVLLIGLGVVLLLSNLLPRRNNPSAKLGADSQGD